MRRFMRIHQVALLAVLLLGARGASAAETESIDWTSWRHLPVMHGGRIMPMDTFAASAAEIVCNRENPTLSIDDVGIGMPASSPALAGARELFPEGERKFTSVELVYSWLVEPEKWEHVPFLIAEHDELRKLLDVPVVNEEGEHLRYVSPSQVQDSDGLYQRLTEISERIQAARAAGEKIELTGVDQKVDELWSAFTLFRDLAVSDTLDTTAHANFDQAFQQVVDQWLQIAPSLEVFGTLGAGGLSNSINECKDALLKLGRLSQQGRMPRAEAEQEVARLEKAAQQLAADFGRFAQQLAANPPTDWSEEQLANSKKLIDLLAGGMPAVVHDAAELRSALYRNGETLRVVPALDVAALERERDPSDRSHAWLDLETLLVASPESIPEYPRRQLEAVQAAYQQAAEAYTNRESPQRAEAVAAGLRGLSRSLRDLAEAIEPLRQKLDFEDRDEELLAYTAYPAADYTTTEVHYNQADPFMKSWIISLCAVFCFALAFGVLRKPMFWLGMAVLAIGLVWTAYGFYLRVAITKWAPVTNMYETVIYVPFFVSLLGAWFALLPILWPGLKNAWRMTAAPFLWEATPLTYDQERMASPGVWTLGGYVSTALRLALMAVVFQVLTMQPYAAGGRHIINLLPVADVGEAGYSFNDLLTWAVGLCVLIPTVWFLPRVVVSLLLGIVTVPRTWLISEKPLLPQVYTRWPFALAATFVAFFGSFTAWYSPVLEEGFSPLTPVLRDNFWLTIHVLTIVSSYGAGALAWGLGNIALAYYLFGRYRPAVAGAAIAEGHRPAGLEEDEVSQQELTAQRPPEACATLAGYIYKTIQVAVLLLITGTILGGLWADVSWGRFWGWDPKEVWALISGLVYLAILHGRYAGWFGNFGLAMGSVLGASAILFSWYGVNFYLGAGLHSYGFGAGGQAEVLTAVLINWAFLGAAGARYAYETASRPTGPATLVKREEPAQTSV